MPKSKGRQKRKPSGSRYNLRPARKKAKKASPRWYGPLILGVMAVGVIIIVANYVGLMPGTQHTATNLWLWVGLGMIALGFLGTTFWY
jgi:hypothetical protein